MMVVVPGGVPIVHLTLALEVVVLISTMKATPFYGSRPAVSLLSLTAVSCMMSHFTAQKTFSHEL